MSDFTGLITDEFKQLHIDAITEVIRGCSVPCQLIFGATKFTDCPNCIFDVGAGKSSNRYQANGPIPFNSGLCPYCNGIGKIADEQTESISLCPIYDYKSWIPDINSNVQSPYGFVQTLSAYNTTYSKLLQAKEILINTDQNSKVRSRFERYGEPQPCGLGSSAFVSTMWKRIES